MSVANVPGFIAGGIHGGIKTDDKLDLAYIGVESEQGALAVGVFTSNKLCAAPVIVTKEHLDKSNGRVFGVVVNSGNANAATGQTGIKNARLMCETAGSTLGQPTERFLVCSTGWIGYQLPIENICEAIPTSIKSANIEGSKLAAQAIMTTDTVEKTFFKTYKDNKGVSFSVGAIAKGAAMLQPNMATMLAFITTDAKASREVMQECLSTGANNSFNKLTVDGAQSTNDTVLLISSEKTEEVDKDVFGKAMLEVCQSLAKQMCDDAEGSTKTVKIMVAGASDESQANLGARRVANCQLVKCSWFGKDPYWGRVASELGASGIDYDFSTLSISYGNHLVLKNGESLLENFNESQKKSIDEYMDKRDIELNIDLGQGNSSGWIYTNDLTFGYVEENMGTS